MKRLTLVAALLLSPTVAAAQATSQPPSVQSQADAAALQVTRLASVLAGQITADQERIESLQRLVSDLQAKLAAASKPAPEKKD